MAGTQFDLERQRALMRRAVADGATIRGSTIEWNLSAGCSDPRLVEMTGRLPRDIRESLGGDWKHISKIAPSRGARFHAKNIEVMADTSYSSLVLTVRCRKCERCRRYRGRLWRLRAQAEIAAASRTWFGTLTLRPTEHSLVLMKAQALAARAAVDWEKDLSDAERFQRRVNAISPEITKYLKRVRKQSGAKVRYCLVSESHKSGLPHFHMLVHETGEQPVRHSVLTEQWVMGYTNFKLAEPAAAGYVTKYLYKSDLAQIRASIAYGSTASAIVSK